MNKEEFWIEAMKIFDEYIEKSEAIQKEAKENGTWLMGLDSNNGLFKGIEKEAKEKLTFLVSMVDKD